MNVLEKQKIFINETGEYTIDLAENYAELGLAKSRSRRLFVSYKILSAVNHYIPELDLKIKSVIGFIVI